MNEEIIMMNKSSFANKIYIIASCLLILAGVIEIFVSLDILPQYIYVSSNYGEVVFGSLCTVASIGSAFISLIVGILDKRFYGFTIKEIVKNMSPIIDIKASIVVEFTSIVIGLLFLTLNLINVLTALFLGVIVLTCYMSCIIWRFICDNDFLLKNIKKYCFNTTNANANDEEIIIRLLNDLSDKINLGNENKKKEYLSLVYEHLSATVKSNEDSIEKNKNPEIERLIKLIFERNCLSVGFAQSYKEILRFDSWDNEEFFDSYKIVMDYINKIKYSSEAEIEKYNISKTINDIIEYMDIDEFEKIRFVFKYLTSFCINNIVNEKFYREILNDIFYNLCFFGNNNGSKCRYKIISFFLKNQILTNESFENAKKIFEMLLDALYNQNRYSKNKYFIATISEIFRAIYFYAFFETGTLKPEHRKNLEKLFNAKNERSIEFNATLSSLILSKNEDVVEWLCSDSILSEDYDKSKIFEHFSTSGAAKNIVWSTKNLLLFSFSMYIAIGSWKTIVFPAEEILENNNCDEIKRRNIYYSIINFFDEKTELRSSVQNIVENLENIFNRRKYFPDSLIQKNYDYYNDLLINLKVQNDSKIKPKTPVKICNLLKSIDEELNKVKEFTFNPKLSLDKCKSTWIKYDVRRKAKNNVEEAGYDFAYILMYYIGGLISYNLREVKIDFGQEGVRTLLSELQSEKYHLCNYKHIDDFAIKQPCRDSADFNKLVNKINDINYIESRYFNDYFYIKEDKIEYNYKIISYELKDLTDDECNQYLSNFQVSDGRYNIDGQILDYNKAFNLLKKLYKSEEIRYKLVVNTTAESGFKVNLDYNNL